MLADVVKFTDDPTSNGTSALFIVSVKSFSTVTVLRPEPTPVLVEEAAVKVGAVLGFFLITVMSLAKKSLL